MQRVRLQVDSVDTIGKNSKRRWKATRGNLRTRLTIAVFFFPVFLAIATIPAEAIKTEYLYLTSRGNEMAPAICDGDTVKVKICTNGTLIQAGPKNSTHPGDIIVYCAGAAVAVPKYMWMCGRAISKYWKDGKWCFKTQLDSSPEPDAWEVPEHYLLGVVVEVTHGANPQNYQPSLNKSSDEEIEGFNVLTLVFDLLIGILIGAVIGIALVKAYPRVTAETPDSQPKLYGNYSGDFTL